ncbi:MAG: TonB-dependent receptor, partial [Chitinophagia bacterium]|nr:TonB-dependent receptor [Chitinophagia bacterium]
MADTASDEPEQINLDSARATVRELQPVEVRAIRAANNAPFAKTDLNRAAINRRNLGVDLPVLLQYTPSAVTTSDAGMGVGYTGLRIRGTDASRINVTFNGLPVNDPEEQNTFFVDIPDIASSASSIQVQRGVGTSTNGAGSFGATISINNLQQNDTAAFSYYGSVGSFNTFRNTFSAGTGLLKGGWKVDVRLSKITSDGYIKRSASDLQAMQVTTSWTPNSRTAFHFLYMNGAEKTGQAWNGVPSDSLNTDRRYNELGLKSDGTFYNNQTDNYRQTYYQLFGDRVTGRFTWHGGLFLTRGIGYYQEYKNAEPYTAYNLPPVTNAAGDTLFSQTDLIRRLWLDNYYYGGVFSLLYAHHNTHAVLGGGWAQFSNLGYGKILWAQNGGINDEQRWYQYDAQKNDANVYLKADHSFGKVTLFGDLQYRNIAYFMNGFQHNPDLRHSVNYNFFNPKAGINWQIQQTPTAGQRAYASVAVAHREPNRASFEASTAQLPKAEALTDVEAGYEINRTTWTAGANLYYMSYSNQLVLTGQINDVGAYTQTNVKESYRAGIELQAACTPLTWLKLMGNATLSQNKIGRFTEYIDNYDSTAQRTTNHSNTDIAFSPAVVSALTLEVTPYRGKKGSMLLVDIAHKYVDRQYLDNTQRTDRQIPSYQFTNILVKYSVHCRAFREVAASVALQN